ncbi:MAG: TolC family protein [Myxococcaceae bacterium]|nr:TolC family protein [Myxococcaceae bacterium]
MLWAWVAVSCASGALTLDEVRAASRENLDAVQSALDLEAAGEGRRLARASILPQLSLSASAGVEAAGPQRRYTTVPNMTGDGYDQQSVDTPAANSANFRLSLQLSQLLYDGGRWWKAIAQAGAQEEAAQGRLDEQRLSSEMEGVRRFYELLRAQKTRDVLNASVARSLSQVERANALYEAGRGKLGDTLDAQINYRNDKISLLRQGQAVTSAQSDLLFWLNRPMADVEAAEPAMLLAPAGESKPVALQSFVDRAKVNRPLLKALERQVAVADAAVGIASASYLPRVSVGAGYTRFAPSADPFFTDPTRQNTVTAGLNLSWDLFNGFETSANTAKARVSLRQAENTQLRATQELEGQLRSALGTLNTQREMLVLSKENLEFAQKNSALAEQRFSAGAGSTLEVRDAELKLTQAQLALLQGRIDVEIARAAVSRLTGIRLEEVP